MYMPKQTIKVGKVQIKPPNNIIPFMANQS